MGDISGPGGFRHRECFERRRISPGTTAVPDKSVISAKGAPGGVQPAGGANHELPSNLRAGLQQAHHHEASCGAGGLDHQRTWPEPGLSADQRVDEADSRHDPEPGRERKEGDHRVILHQEEV